MRAVFLVLFVSILCGGCERGPSAENSQKTPPAISSSAPRRTVRGVVKALPASRASVAIAHEEIPDYMKAMTMDFEVARPALLEGIKVGDTVSFTFVEAPGYRLVIEALEAAPATP
ncbi:copper-binding protein [Chondromyces crocatus]|uniref:Copper-binding protein n=1 Tax=Chondromyces crocatus TaxID=52 RepID=A0A0K1E616_CHOCO|nr:copper-binding protein [Chondromyces crocatus]AKT36117.1 uncharacterized protein CMC5_002300 [Chondromyces crocatus]